MRLPHDDFWVELPNDTVMGMILRHLEDDTDATRRDTAQSNLALAAMGMQILPRTDTGAPDYDMDKDPYMYGW